MKDLVILRSSYCQAFRCWQSNNLKSCALICNGLTQDLIDLERIEKHNHEVGQLKQLVWFLKIKCLTEDYHINESFLTNEDDIESDEQVRTFQASSAAGTKTTRPTDVRPTTSLATRNRLSGGTRMATRTRPTGMLTGRMPMRTATRHSGHTTTSYRPLTTSLTASQTAFSRSTRPLLKYSSNSFLSKAVYEYLYNAQNVTNICPDYRQCLEYLNLVGSARRRARESGPEAKAQSGELLISLSSDQDDSLQQRNLGAYWSLAFGICYFHLKMNKQAEEFFQASQSLDRKSLDAYLWLIKVYLRMNQPIRVLKTCHAGSLSSPNAILYSWKARVQSLQGASLAAHSSLRDSLQHCPTNIEALANVGYHSFYADKKELALKCFERIYQLSMNTGCSPAGNGGPSGLLSAVLNDSSAELFSNMALCSLQCGYYSKVMPLFQRAFLNSPNKEMTSNIWFNISFVPLTFGARQLAMACLRLALRNDSQNEEAINNLGVLKYDWLINDPLHYRNRQEYWCLNSSRSSGHEFELTNHPTEQRRLEKHFDIAETFFGSPMSDKKQIDPENSFASESSYHNPEMLYNMAVLKRKRGQMADSVKCCAMYLQYDENDYTIRGILSEINQLISHDC